MPGCSPNATAAGCPFSLFQSRDPFAVKQTATRGLTNVARDELRHLEHADLALAIENRSERIVGVDLGSLRFVLKTVLLDVVPELFRKLGTRQWF